jgi:opacity protein-like surface antigen
MAFGTSSVEATVRLHTFMGGVRVAARTHPKVVPFGQVLLGAARVSGGVTASGPAVSVIEATDSDTRFALQIGGGVNLMTSGNFGVRLGVDYRRIFVSDAGENEFRVAAGVVIPIGK